jgi:hypothetical protein
MVWGSHVQGGHMTILVGGRPLEGQNIKLQKLDMGVRLGRIADLVRDRDQDELIVATPSHLGKSAEVYLVSGKDLHTHGASGRLRLDESVVLPDGRKARVVSSIPSSERINRMRELFRDDLNVLANGSFAAAILGLFAGETWSRMARALSEPTTSSVVLVGLAATFACLLVLGATLPLRALDAMGENRRRNPRPI